MVSAKNICRTRKKIFFTGYFNIIYRAFLYQTLTLTPYF